MKTSLRSAWKFFMTLCFFVGLMANAHAQVANIDISSVNQTVNPTITYNAWLVTGLSNEMIGSVCIVPATPYNANINAGAFAPAVMVNTPFSQANSVGIYNTGGLNYTELSVFPNNTIFTTFLPIGSPTNILPTMTIRRNFRICSNNNETVNLNFTVFCDDVITNVNVDGVTIPLTGFAYPANAIAPKTINQNVTLTPGLHWIEITGADLENPNGQNTTINIPGSGVPAQTRQWNPFAVGIRGNISSPGGNLVLLNSDSGISVNPITGPSTLCANTGTITLADATPGGTWSSSDPTIATINPSTGVVSGIAPGSATITYTVGTGPCAGTATYNISVTACHCEDPCSWSVTGNTTVYPYNFIGSINNADFKIRTNNTEKMIVTAGGNVGIGTSSPAQLLDVNGQARIQSLPVSAPNERIVFANNSGDLHSLNATGAPGDYLGGDGTWHTLSGGGGGTVTGADQGVTLNGTTVMLGDYCGGGGGQFQKNREINMNDNNLYFNSNKNGKIYMGIGASDRDDCKRLESRLEISSLGLPAVNDYVSPNPGISGLRFTDLIPKNVEPIENRTGGVLSLDDDGDVIWVQACCGRKEVDAKLDALTARLDKLEAELTESRNQNTTLTQQLSKMDVILSQANTVILNQNTPNPFAESTVITYSIPKSFSKAQIIFRTVTGEVIKTADIKSAGKGLITVYASDISKGLYTYTLVIDGKTIDTKKMIKE